MILVPCFLPAVHSVHLHQTDHPKPHIGSSLLPACKVSMIPHCFQNVVWTFQYGIQGPAIALLFQHKPHAQINLALKLPDI